MSTATPDNNTSVPLQGRLALTRDETAQALGICPKSVDRLRQRGLLRASYALGRPRFAVREIQRFLDETSQPVEVA
ncbi:helix-turn-helix domain-containing protein [Ruficoccus amylovorans]|uniref:helix-turn-helix domain-containing protein n=1 Tax=Ruficoccus amylovorans TaxID=1804625 RepID=UPI003CCCB426